MSPFGGAEGYKAAIPDEEDPQNENVIGEIGLKYLMGRIGQLLPYEEFKKVTPDVAEKSTIVIRSSMTSVRTTTR